VRNYDAGRYKYEKGGRGYYVWWWGLIHLIFDRIKGSGET
jgi:hypothetical protein